MFSTQKVKNVPILTVLHNNNVNNDYHVRQQQMNAM